MWGLQHVGSSRTRRLTHVLCIGRRPLNHQTTREALVLCSSFPACFWIGQKHVLVTHFTSPIALLAVPPWFVSCVAALGATCCPSQSALSQCCASPWEQRAWPRLSLAVFWFSVGSRGPGRVSPSPCSGSSCYCSHTLYSCACHQPYRIL